MNENRHRTLSLMNDIHPGYIVNVAFGGAKDGIDGKIGRDGEPGKDGAPGEDGFSPIVEAYRNPDDTGIIVRVTDKDGTKETYVQDGTSSGGNDPVLYIENESQYTTGYSILRYNRDEIPAGYDSNYLDSTFILQVVAIGHGEFCNKKRYSAYFAVSFRHDADDADAGVLPYGITCTYLHGDFKPTFEIKKTSAGIVSLEFIHIGKDVEDAGFDDFEYGTDVAFYVSHYSGNIPYDEFASMFARDQRIDPLATPRPNYTYLVDINRSELFNQRLDDVLRFKSIEDEHETNTRIDAYGIDSETTGSKTGRILIDSAETDGGLTTLQSGKLMLGLYGESGDDSRLITLDALNSESVGFQTIIQPGSISTKDTTNNYQTISIVGTSDKPYIDLRNSSSGKDIKLKVDGTKGSTSILNGQMILKDESGNKQIDISSRTDGKGIIKLSDTRFVSSESVDNNLVFKLFDTSNNEFLRLTNYGLAYSNGTNFIPRPYIDSTIPVIPDTDIQVDDSSFCPKYSLGVYTPSGSTLINARRDRWNQTAGGIKYLISTSSSSIENEGYTMLSSSRRCAAKANGNDITSTGVEYITSLQNSGYSDMLTAYVRSPYPGESGSDIGAVELKDAMGASTITIETMEDDNGDQYDEVRIAIGCGVDPAYVDGHYLTYDDRLYLNSHKLSDIVTQEETFTNSGSTLQLKNNTIYTASGDISNKAFSYSSGDCIIEFTTASSGSVTIQFPTTITFDEYPTFGNEEHWIIGIRDGWAVWVKYDLSQ